MRFGSACSGIEAASVAFNPLGWEAAWFSEIEAFPSAVLRHHYPHVPNWGDMTLLAPMIRAGLVEAPDVLCGGTPCQAFSVAGLRESLDDERGNLTLEFVKVADAIDSKRDNPCIVLWENVPGVLSTKDNAFGCFLGELVGEGQALSPGAHRWADAGVVIGPKRTAAWRILDAQFFGLAQRRRRVFVVASARQDFNPAAVLLEWDGLRRDTAPSREAGEGSAAGTLRSPDGGNDVDHASAGHLTLSFKPGQSEAAGGVFVTTEYAPTLQAQNNGSTAVPAVLSIHENQREEVTVNDTAGALTLGGGKPGQGYPAVLAFGGGNTLGPIDVAAAALNANRGCRNPGDFEAGTLLAHTLRGEGFDASEDGTGRGTPLVPEGVRYAHYSHDYANDRITDPSGVNPALTERTSASGNLNVLAFNHNAQAAQLPSAGHDLSATPALTCSQKAAAVVGARVRRLTPEECEKLQGFPVGYTRIPTWNGWRKLDANETPEQCREQGLEVRQNPKTGAWRVKDDDGPRYKALGNSWAVPCVRWIAERVNNAILKP